jgi:membrane-bound lytic murein transglycosylase D
LDDALDSVEALVVPVAPPSAPAGHAEIYKAHRGDTLVKIADRFGVSLDDLHRWNHATGTSVVAGQRIRVSEPARVAPHTRDRSRQRIQASTSHGAQGKSGATQTAVKSASNTKTAATKKTAKQPATKRPHSTTTRNATPKSGKSSTAGAHFKGKRKKNIQK